MRNKVEEGGGSFFIRLHLKEFCASILETSHSVTREAKLWYESLITIKHITKKTLVKNNAGLNLQESIV